MTNNDLYDFGLRIVRLIENDDLYVKALIKKNDEIERLREALKYCVSALEQYGKQFNSPPTVKQLEDLKDSVLGALHNARTALKEGE